MSDVSHDTPMLGIDLGGTKILAAVIDPQNRVLARAKRSTPAAEGADALMAALEQTAREAIEAAALRPIDIGAGGIGSPGPLDIERGLIIRSANLNVKNFPLAPGLTERLGFPFRAWNDVRVGGYGEWRLGAGRDHANMLAAFVGTGIGGCVVVHNRIVEGVHGNAGEIGHIVLKAGGPKCGCGQRGCMEALASRTAIVRRIGKAVARGQNTVLADHFEGGKTTRIKSKELLSAYTGGDPVVVREIQRAASFLGLGLGSLMNVLGPEVVVVGGGVVQALGETYLKLVREAARPHILAEADGNQRIVLSALGDDSGVLGASLLAREFFTAKPATSVA